MNERAIIVAVPAYTGSITVETAESLQAELYAAHKAGIKLVVQFSQGDPIIHRARNLMVREFLKTGCDDMIFVDSDVGFPMGTLLKLASHPVDLVGAVYPKRKDPLEFPVRWLKENRMLYPDPDTGLLEVEGFASGCMRMSRKLLETMVDKNQDLAYYNHDGGMSYSLFDFERHKKIMFGEDITFCRRARACGFKAWIDPTIDMTHTGYKRFDGNVGNWLLSRPEAFTNQQEAA